MTGKKNPFIDDDVFEAYRMSANRANEIIKDGSEFSNWSDKCSHEEKAYINRVWDTMPPETCWYDALVRISRSITEKVVTHPITGEKFTILTK